MAVASPVEAVLVEINDPNRIMGGLCACLCTRARDPHVPGLRLPVLKYATCTQSSSEERTNKPASEADECMPLMGRDHENSSVAQRDRVC